MAGLITKVLFGSLFPTLLVFVFNIHSIKSNFLPFAGLSIKCKICVLNLSITKCTRLSATASNGSLQMVLTRNNSEVGQGDIPGVARRNRG